MSLGESLFLKGKNAESFLHELAVNSFLTDWCFLNPKFPDGKELCDLLVVFDQIAIIWQVKDLKKDEDGFYKKSEVEKNIKQLIGAKRALFELKKPIELENVRRNKEPFNPEDIKEVYLISALLGEGEDIYSFAETIKDQEVHVFDREFTQVALKELDTISDFVSYLKAKEEFLRKKAQLVIDGGEKELLGYYLLNERSFQKLYEYNHISLTDGIWEGFTEKPEYKAKKKADEISYGWDSMINRAHEGSDKYERVARELARPNRFERRYLSIVFMEAHVKAHEAPKDFVYRRILPMDGVSYCFLFQDNPISRESRQGLLSTICYIARMKFPDNKKVIGIATEKTIRPTCAYDFCALDMPDWTDKDQEFVENLQKETGFFTNPIIGHTSDTEYPIVEESDKSEK